MPKAVLDTTVLVSAFLRPIEGTNVMRVGAPAGSLPSGWAWAELGELGSWIGGGTPSKSVAAYWANGSIPWVSPKDMKTEVIEDTEDHITEAAVAGSATKFVPPDSVLMVMRSGILRHTFPVAVNVGRVTVNQDLRALVPAADANPRYIAHYLRGIQRQVLDECAKDGTTVQSVEVSALERVRIPIAPLPEQRRIVARIDELFAEIAEGEAALERARRGLDTWRRALLKAAVTGELTRDWREKNRPAETGADLLARIRCERKHSLGPAGRNREKASVGNINPSLLPELPSGWTWARLGDLGEIVCGVTVDKKRVPDNPIEVPYLRVANVQRGFLELSEVKTIRVEQSVAARLDLNANDILLNEGGDRDKIGRGWVWQGELPVCIHQNHVFRVRPFSKGINPYFVSHYANELGRAFFMERGKQTTNLASISMSKISELPVPVPPPGEAQIIIDRVSEALAVELDCRKELADARALLQSQRQSILKSAFEGRLVPQDPAEEPASALLARLRQSAAAPRPARRRGRSRAPAGQPPLPL